MEQKTAKKSRKGLKITITIVVIVLVLSGLGFLGYRIAEKVLGEQLNTETFYEGIVVQGIDLGGKTKEQAKEALTALEPELRGDILVTATYGEERYTYITDNFDFTYDLDDVLEKAFDVARKDNLFKRFSEVKDLKENPQSFTITASITEESIDKVVSDIAAKVNRDPVEAQVDGFDAFAENPFTYVEGHNGVSIDQDALKASLTELLKSETKQGEFAIQATEMPCTTTTEDVKNKTQFASSYSTESTNDAAGNHNMALALSKVNGTILQPGETFSFNGIVGDSTSAAGGWEAAGAIVDGKSAKEYGGGICQASTTLYGAVLRADLEIVERHNHSWPSTYVPIGQDASINYGSMDFQFKNNTDSPVYIGATMEGSTLMVKIYRQTPTEWDSIDISSTQTASIQPDDPITKEDASLAPGEQVIERKARVGARAVGSKIYYKDGAQVKTVEIASSYYRPIQGITLVGPN